MIEIDLLLQYGAKVNAYNKGDTIVQEGQSASSYFQIKSGRVKMNNYSDDGKEFIQAIFEEGQSFGEPPLFIDEGYPANAEALTMVELYQLSKEAFLNMLKQENHVSMAINKSLAKRLYYKSIMAPDISSQDAQKRILTLLTYFKDHQKGEKQQEFIVELTRQQIGDLTGLRVETVIRSLKQLEKENQVRIVRSKVIL